LCDGRETGGVRAELGMGRQFKEGKYGDIFTNKKYKANREINSPKPIIFFDPNKNYPQPTI
jgi:hypothetical protein